MSLSPVTIVYYVTVTCHYSVLCHLSLQCTMYDMVEYHGHHQEGGHTQMAVPRTPPQAGHKIHRGSPIQLLEELCHKNHWGTPIYSLHTAAGPADTPLYYYKVRIKCELNTARRC